MQLALLVQTHKNKMFRVKSVGTTFLRHKTRRMINGVVHRFHSVLTGTGGGPCWNQNSGLSRFLPLSDLKFRLKEVFFW